MSKSTSCPFLIHIILEKEKKPSLRVSYIPSLSIDIGK